MAKNDYSVEEAMIRFEKEGLVFPYNEQVVKDFYNQILELEKQNKNGIWARFLKNVFAPMVAGKFDFVVGNPPWIRWDFLAGEYREATKHLWKDYGLFSLKGYAQMLGGAKPDFSMLFVYASSDYYLEDGAKLGFLVTQEVFKSKGAGEGFRRFQLGYGKYLKVLKAHDLASIQPFEGATNKTAAIILKKGEKTEYPVSYIVWSKKKGVGKIATDKSLDEVSNLLNRKKLLAKPISSNVGPWQTREEGKEILINIEGQNSYKGREGVNTSPYGVFWLKIIQVLSDGTLFIQNRPEDSKIKIQSVQDRIEPNLVYPAVRGSDIDKWGVNLEIYILLPNPPSKEPYPEPIMKANYPRSYSYLTKFKDILLSRASRPLRILAEKTAFYANYGVGEYTFSQYKVIWKQMSKDISSAVISQFKTVFGYKVIIPLHTTAFIPTNNESEAHYLCAIINSTPVRDFIKSFSSAGRGFGTPSVMEHVGIPKFDPKNPLHQKLAEISKQCHQLKAEGKDSEIAKLEQENDNLVKQLFQII
jgi:methylase of polypeptide subunit release factors